MAGPHPQEICSSLHSASLINKELQKIWCLDLDALKHRESINILTAQHYISSKQRCTDLIPLNNVMFWRCQKKAFGGQYVFPGSPGPPFL